MLLSTTFNDYFNDSETHKPKAAMKDEIPAKECAQNGELATFIDNLKVVENSEFNVLFL